MNVTDSVFYAVRFPVLVASGLLSSFTVFVVVYLLVKKPSLCQDGKVFFLIVLVLFRYLNCFINLITVTVTFWFSGISQLLCSVYLLFEYFIVFMEYNCLSAMCVDRYVAICSPFHYQSLCCFQNILKILFGLTVLSCGMPLAGFIYWTYSISASEDGGSFLWCQGHSLNHALSFKIPWITLLGLWFSFSIVVIGFCYIMVYKEGKKAGVIIPSNKRATKTIVFQVLQLSLSFFPLLVSLVLFQLPEWRLMKWSTYSVIEAVNFIVSTLAQTICPVIYGLRSRSIRDIVKRLFCSWKLRTKLHPAS
uniref:Olfactory receptor 2AP1-like n=1 Tax=Geotrypetes seraphini TaxID=260995 RepID=A0A6P8SEZ6_GEOSA|nr:olfactory receptor 2AP1-like [Geotrypetes seraphini]